MLIRILALFMALLFVSPGLSRAWPWDRKVPRIGSDVAALPGGYSTVRVGGEVYYYKSGVFYSRAGSKYMVIRPPVGAVVKSLPGHSKKKEINGVTYYTNSRTYYMRTPEGYRVVAAPIGAVQ